MFVGLLEVGQQRLVGRMERGRAVWRTPLRALLIGAKVLRVRCMVSFVRVVGVELCWNSLRQLSWWAY